MGHMGGDFSTRFPQWWQWFYADQAMQAGLVDGLTPTLAHVVAELLE